MVTRALIAEEAVVGLGEFDVHERLVGGTECVGNGAVVLGKNARVLASPEEELRPIQLRSSIQ